MNILFMTSPAPPRDKAYFSTAEKRAPLGVGYLISVVKNAGHQAFFIDHYLKEQHIDYADYLKENCIDFVGIYANTICFQGTLKILNELQGLREKNIWNGKLIVGGPHTTVAMDTIPDYVDYIVLGEGEVAILDILNGTDEKVIKRARIMDLDTLPFPAWDVFVKLSYDYTCEWTDKTPVFTMNTSRGCPYGCSFCSVESIWGKRYTFYSAQRIIDEIQYFIKEFGAEAIYFREDNFTLNNKRVIEFCTLLTESNISIEWVCETRVDTLDEKLIKLMASSGCRGFYIGVESGSQKMLDRMNKNISIESETREL